MFSLSRYFGRQAHKDILVALAHLNARVEATDRRIDAAVATVKADVESLRSQLDPEIGAFRSRIPMVLNAAETVPALAVQLRKLEAALAREIETVRDEIRDVQSRVSRGDQTAGGRDEPIAI